MSMMHCAVYWLCLLHAALATIVDASHPNNQDRSWPADVSSRHTGGSRHTNISGATDTYSFAGSLYVVTHRGDANFSCSINNGPSQSCSYWRNDKYQFGYELCTLSGLRLDGMVQHTFTITHTDVDGFWLHFDHLEVTFTSTATSVTSSSSLTPSPTTSTTIWPNTTKMAMLQTQTASSLPKSAASSDVPTQTPEPHCPLASPGLEPANVGAIVGGVVGGLVGVTLICMVVFIVVRSHRPQINLITAGPDIKTVASGAGGRSFTSAPFAETVEASLPSAHRPDATSPETSITNNNRLLFKPLPTIPSAAGPFTVRGQPFSSGGDGPSSFYPTAVAPYTASRRQESTSQPFPSQEDPVSLPPLNVGNSQQGIESGGRMYSRSDVAGGRTSGEGSSYRT